MPSTDKHSRSLSEVHSSVNIPKNVSFFKRLLAFAGPAYLVSVGYMDPGNWATDIEGGARFGYQLIWVLLMSNLMAVLLQTLAARMGIVTGRDLAQACRDQYPKPVVYALWLLCEVAIAACDLAEVLGTAIGLNLLLKVPLVYGVIITGFDTFIILMVQHYGIRKLEAFILMFVATIGICFLIELFFAQPSWPDVMRGFIPHLSKENLYIAVGILGATVMPHNLYLHSALVQTRTFDQTDEGKKTACRYNLIDTSVALNAAFFVNSAILIVAAAVFFNHGIVVTQIQQAYNLLTPLLGTSIAGTLFAVALISAGQSSTLTGTLAGQIVMEGFLQFKIRPVLRRVITRFVAIVPAVVVIAFRGDEGSYDLLILSQVVLSLQLPFAIIPLIKFTSDRSVMGTFTNRLWVKVLAWITAAIIVVLNAKLVVDTIGEWIGAAGPYSYVIWGTAVPLAIGIALLLVYISVPKVWRERKKPVPAAAPVVALGQPRYARIGAAIDYGAMDATVLSHAQMLARQNGATMFIFHVVEGVSGQVYGKDAFDDEARKDQVQLETIADQLRASGLNAHAALGYGRVAAEIVRLSKEYELDLLVMGGHGHRWLEDILFGTSITEVRHEIGIPVLVVQ